MNFQTQIKKVVINIGVGSPGEKLGNAEKILERVTGKKPVRTQSKEKIPDFGIQPGVEIGCKVTLRGKKAEEVLKNLLDTLDDLKRNQVGRGSLSFGIEEYIEIPGLEYDPEIGMFGMDVSVTLENPGKSKLDREETINFFKEKFDMEVKE